MLSVLSAVAALLVCMVLTATPTTAAEPTRSLALAGTDSAFVADAGGVFRNPAGLSRLQDRELQVSYGLRGVDRVYLVSYAEPDYGTGAGGLAFSSQDDGDIGMVSYSIAYSIAEGLALGATIRYQSHGDVGGRYVTSDLGVQYQPFSRVQFSLVMDDVLHKEFSDNDEPLEPSLRSGLAVLFDQMTLAAEFDNMFKDDQRQLRLGVEVTLQTLQFRAGLRSQSQNNTVFSGGLGLQLPSGQVDYALVAAGDSEMRHLHQAGFSLRF